jgi:hypothetical protein
MTKKFSSGSRNLPVATTMNAEPKKRLCANARLPEQFAQRGSMRKTNAFKNQLKSGSEVLH